MISENDKFNIPDRYLKMSISELRKEKEQLLDDLNTAIDAGVLKPEGEKDSSWFRRNFKDNAEEIESAIRAISGAIPDDGKSLEEYREERLKRYEISDETEGE